MQNTMEGLTTSEIDLIRNSWQPFKEHLQELAVTFFLEFFKRRADYQELFPFRGVPLDELRQNERFRRHATSVFKFIDTAIASLENIPEVLHKIDHNGKIHAAKNLNLEWSHYEHLDNTLLDVISQYCEEYHRPLNTLEKETWAKLLRFVSSNIHESVLKHQTAMHR